MKTRTLTILVLTAMVAAAAGAETLSITVPDSWLKGQVKETTIPLSVTGTANVKAVPDRVVITANIYTQNKKAGQAFDDNQYKVRALTDALVAVGIPREMIATQSLTIQPVYGKTYAKVESYNVSRTLKIVQDDMGKISPVLDGLIDAGVGDIGTIQFVVKDMDKKYREAIEAAAADARSTGEKLAAAMGGRIVGVESISYDFGGYNADADRRGMMREAAADIMSGAENQMIVPSEVSGVCNVHVVFKVQYVGP